MLIVDDEVQARELLSEFCRAQGYVVATANDGRAALAAIARRPRQFGIFITNSQSRVQMALKCSRLLAKPITVVMITGYASIDSAVAMAGFGDGRTWRRAHREPAMLVFTRRRDEAIMIGDGIEVRVLRVGRDGVRLGIVARSEVRVHRREIYDQIREATHSAAAAPARLASVKERLTKAR